MQQSPSSEANSSVAGQCVFQVLWKKNVQEFFTKAHYMLLT